MQSLHQPYPKYYFDHILRTHSSFQFYSVFLYTAISSVPKLTCLCIWAPSVCGFSHSRSMFRICHKVILNGIHAAGSFKASFLIVISVIYFCFIVSVWASCSIVHDNEFSARLSVGSILRLRAAAIVALSEDSNTDTTLIFRLARRFLYFSDYQTGRIEVKHSSELHCPQTTDE